MYYHTKCGGKIDTEKKRCTKCKKQWNWFTLYFNILEIRQERSDKETCRKKYAEKLESELKERRLK